MVANPEVKSLQVVGSKETWSPQAILVRCYPISITKIPPLAPKQVLDIYPVARHYGINALAEDCLAATATEFDYTHEELPISQSSHKRGLSFHVDAVAFLEAAEQLQVPWLGEKAFKHIARILASDGGWFYTFEEIKPMKAQLAQRLQGSISAQPGSYYGTALQAMLPE